MNEESFHLCATPTFQWEGVQIEDFNFGPMIIYVPLIMSTIEFGLINKFEYIV